MRSRRLLPMLVLVLLAVPASAGAAVHGVDAAAKDEGGGVAAKAAASASFALAPGRVIRTRRSWECTGRLRRYGRLPIKVISNMPNPGNADAIRLTGCRGDGKRRTVDLILDVNGNGPRPRHRLRRRQDRHGRARPGRHRRRRMRCAPHGSQHPPGHRPGALRPEHRLPELHVRESREGLLTLGCRRWYVTHGNGGIPRNLICSRCRLATYNQNLRIDRSIPSQAIRLRLQPLVRHLHRPGSPTAREQAETASSSTEGPGEALVACGQHMPSAPTHLTHRLRPTAT